MSILAEEIKFYLPARTDDTALNGGLMSNVEIVTDLKNNVFPDITEAQRTAGITQYRKLFYKVENADNEALADARIYISTITAGDDFVTMFPGTQRDTQGDISNPEEFGAGVLHETATAGGSTILVDIKSSALDIFHADDLIRITQGGVDYDFVVNTAVKVSTQYTITLKTTLPVTMLANAVVSAVIAIDSIATSVEDWDETAATGTYDSTTYPIVVDNIGGIEQDWTLTFTSATAFDISGHTLGAISTGSISVDCAPSNAFFAKPYFTIQQEGWGAGWLEGDIITFTTHPASIAIWRKRVVPAGAAEATVDGYTTYIAGNTTA